MPSENQDETTKAVDNFLWVQQALTGVLKSGRPTSPRDREIWAHMHNARLFVIPLMTFAKVYRAADIYTTTKLANMSWAPMEQLPTASVVEIIEDAIESDPLAYKQAIIEAGKEVPAPEKLPFDSIFLCYSKLMMAESQLFVRQLYEAGDSVQWVGHLLYYTKDEFKAFEILRIGEGKRAEIVVYPVFFNHEWLNPMDLNPWVLNMVVQLVTKQQRFVIERPLSFEQRLKLRHVKRGKLSAPIPQPYYVITLRDQVIDETLESESNSLHKRTFEYSYRFDVQGHERCKIRRGSLPLEPKLAAKLEARGYQVFTVSAMPAEHLERLGRREIAPKRPDEWLAIKVRWVEDYQKGPKDAPYVPAIRLPG